MKKIFSFVLVLLTILEMLPVGVFASAATPDYVSLFGALINEQENGDTKLKNLLSREYQTCDVSWLKDCYMVDMNNDSVPELLCILYDKENYALNIVLVEYDDGFKVGKEIPFKYNSGSGGSECTYVLKAGGKFYFEEYKSGRGDAGSYREEWSDQLLKVKSFSKVFEKNFKTYEKNRPLNNESLGSWNSHSPLYYERNRSFGFETAIDGLIGKGKDVFVITSTAPKMGITKTLKDVYNKTLTQVDKIQALKDVLYVYMVTDDE